MIVATWAALQIPLLGILALISYDKKAKLEANSREALLAATVAARNMDAELNRDEWAALLTEAYEQGAKNARALP